MAEIILSQHQTRTEANQMTVELSVKELAEFLKEIQDKKIQDVENYNPAAKWEKIHADIVGLADILQDAT